MQGMLLGYRQPQTGRTAMGETSLEKKTETQLFLVNLANAWICFNPCRATTSEGKSRKSLRRKMRRQVIQEQWKKERRNTTDSRHDGSQRWKLYKSCTPTPARQ